MTISIPEEERLLSEISHKLDYAIHNARAGAGRTAGAEGPDPGLIQGLRSLLLPQPPEALHQRILDVAIDAVRAERGFLMMVEEGRKLRYKVGRSVDKQSLQSDSDTSRTIIRQVMQSGRSVVIADTSSSDVTSSSLQGLKLRSILCAPLLFGSPLGGEAEVGGVLYLDCRTLIRTFDQRSREVLDAIADHASAAITAQLERQRLASYDPEAEKVQENFRRLIDVGQAISSTLVLDDLLELVMEKVLEVTRADRGFVMLLEEGQSNPQFKVGLSWNKQDGPARRKVKLKEAQFFFSRSVCRQALEERRSVVIQDAQAGAEGDASLSIVQMDLHSVMVTPLAEKGRVLGLIYVDSKMSNKSFGESDVALFEALAGQAAIGLQNALLYSQVAAQQRIESEIAIAAELQRDLCPKQLPRLRGLELVGHMQPAREVGGDYYDMVQDPRAPEDVLAVVVGDVSGKGLGAGMVAVMARCFLRPMLGAYGMDDPAQLLTFLNATLVPELKPGSFMTMLLLVWDARRRVIRYASAGHENLLVWRSATRRAEIIPSGGSPLGISATRGGPTPNAELTLKPGDTVVLYTDGVTEAMNALDEELTLERLVALVEGAGGRPPGDIQDAVLAALAQHRGGREPSDDVTLVILRAV